MLCDVRGSFDQQEVICQLPVKLKIFRYASVIQSCK